MKKQILKDIGLTTYACFPEQEIKSAAIFFHGYGADGQDLFSLSAQLSQILPNTAFFFPDAPTKMAGFFGGYEWFSLDNYDPVALLDKQKGEAYLNALMPLAKKVHPLTQNYVKAILEKTNLPASKAALCGFSQGGLMAVYTALRFPEKLALTVGLSAVSVMFDEKTFSINDIVSKPPVCLIHGDADAVVPLSVFEKNQENLTKAGLELETHIVPGLMHGIDQTALTLLAAALKHSL